MFSRMFNPPHPGEILKEFLPHDLTVTEAALMNQNITLEATSAGWEAVAEEPAEAG